MFGQAKYNLKSEALDSSWEVWRWDRYPSRFMNKLIRKLNKTTMLKEALDREKIA